jgi:hypothetical protein
MLVTLDGIVMDLSVREPANAWFPMLIAPSAITTAVPQSSPADTTRLVTV